MRLLRSPLFWIFVVGFALRVGGIGYGLPYFFHPDEKREVLEAFAMGEARTLLPVTYAYPILHTYVLLIIYGVVWCTGFLFGIYQVPEDMGLHLIHDPTLFVILSRLASVMMGMVVIYLVERMGRMLFSRTVGLLGALLVAVNFLLVQISQWGLAEALIVLTATAAFYFLFSWIQQGKIRSLNAAACLGGLVLSTKYQGLFVAFPILMAAWMGPRTDRLKRLLRCALIFGLAGLVGNLGWFFLFDEKLLRYQELAGMARYGLSSIPLFDNNPFDYALWFSHGLVRQQGAVGVLLLSGIVFSLWARERADGCFLVFVCVMLAALSQSSIRYVYLGSLMFPLLSLFAARAVVGVTGLFAKRYSVWMAIGTILLSSVPAVAHTTQANQLKSGRDTRVLAKQWVEEHIPNGSRIAVDWYIFGPPLAGQNPSVIEGPRNPTSGGKRLPEGLQKRYLEEIAQSKTLYEIIPMLVPQENPHWPQDMPQEAIRRAEENLYFKHLYGFFHFRSLEELKTQGAQYVIISSFCYSHFLLDEDPLKGPFFNAFMKENTMDTHRQASLYQAGSQAGLLYFLIDQVRKVYTPFLSDPPSPGLELLHEVRPSDRHWGPILKIYRIVNTQGQETA